MVHFQHRHVQATTSPTQATALSAREHASPSRQDATLRRMTQPNASRDLHVRLTYADLSVTIVAEGVSYSPDALSDMANRAVNMLTESLLVVAPHERALATAALDDDEDYDEDE